MRSVSSERKQPDRPDDVSADSPDHFTCGSLPPAYFGLLSPATKSQEALLGLGEPSFCLVAVQQLSGNPPDYINPFLFSELMAKSKSLSLLVLENVLAGTAG